MRVKGNISPDELSIEPYRPKDGYVEVRLRNNIKSIVEVDNVTGQEISLFEHDEYTFVLRDREGLRGDIEANMSDWLATGRTLEVNAGASIMVDMQTQNAEYEAALTEIENALGVTAE